MEPRVRAGNREEATERLKEQYEEGEKHLQTYPGIRTKSEMATCSTRGDAEDTMRGFRDAKERWANRTRMLLEKYFDTREFALEFADRATEDDGYGNQSHDPTSEALGAAINYLQSILDQMPDLEEKTGEANPPSYTLKLGRDSCRDELKAHIENIQKLRQNVADGKYDLDTARDQRDQWSTESNRLLREVFKEVEVSSGFT